MASNLPLLIGGDFIESISKEYLEVTSPLSQEILCKVPCASKKEINKAVTSTVEAFSSWKESTAPERARVMMNYQALLKEHQEELVDILSKEKRKNF